VNAAADRGTGAGSTPRADGRAPFVARCAAQVNLTATMSVKANMNKKLAVACLMTVVLWGGPGVRSAWAGGHGWTGGHGGSAGHGDFHGHDGFRRHGGFHGDFGFFIGAPLFWPPPYYPYYGYPYDYPPAVVIERQPQVYIQREPYYWYYCPEPSGYYPYVQNCPRGWQQVVPSAPPQ
jgi:hypothetical protein